MMRRVTMLLLVLLVVALVVVGYAAPTMITDRAVMNYTDAETGEVYPAASVEGGIPVLTRPKVDVPRSALRGVPATIVVTADVGGTEWLYPLVLPLYGGTLVPDSLVITGGTGTLVGNILTFDPLAEAGEVTCSYKLVW